MTYPDEVLEEAAGRLVDDQEFMIIDAPDQPASQDDPADKPGELPE